MRLGLPALLQRLDRVNAQFARVAQHPRLLDHGLAHQQRTLLLRLQRRGSRVDGRLPERLQFGEHLFTDMAAIAPAVAKLVQQTIEAFPVLIQRGPVVGRPGIEFLDQRQALGAVLRRLGLDLFEPNLDHLVGLVAGIVKALPEAVIGHPALVGLLPLLAQGAQVFLHLAPPNGLPLRAVQQALRLLHQFFTQLIGAPTLPAFEFAGRRQRRVRLVLQFVVDDPAEFLERLAQRPGGPGAGFAMPLGNLLLQPGEHFTYRRHRLRAHLRVDRRAFRSGRRGLGQNTPGLAQFLSPHRHWRQRRAGILGSTAGLRQGRPERLPDDQQLAARGFEQWRKLDIHAGPVRIIEQDACLRLPVFHIGLQCLKQRLRVTPGLG